MRSLEVHVFETESDLDNALQCGLVRPEQVAWTTCTACDDPVCYCDGGFETFVLVIDENDQDWGLCETCAAPIIDYVDTFFPPVTKSHFQSDEYDYF